MKSLIRFEDTYGLADIFCARKGIDYLDREKIKDKMIELAPDLFMDFGLGSGWGRMSQVEAYDIMERGIERIILVYDMDNLCGDKTNILQKEDLNEAINNMQQAFESIAYNVEICYIPVVYAAETLMLYQYLSEENGVRIFNLVSSVNTNYLHLCILAYLTGRANVRHAKRVREFLDIHRLVDNFKSMVEYDINREVKQWIIDGCNVESQSLFDKHDALEHLKETESIFNCWKAQSNRTLKIDEHIIALDKTVKPLMKMK